MIGTKWKVEPSFKNFNEFILISTCINWPFFESSSLQFPFNPVIIHKTISLTSSLSSHKKERWVPCIHQRVVTQHKKKLKELAHEVVFIENKLACNNNKSEYLVCNVQLLQSLYLLLSSFDDEGHDRSYYVK